MGPEWRSAALAASLPELVPYGSAPFTIGSAPVHVLRMNGFDANGLMLVGTREAAPTIEALAREAAESVGGAVLDPSSYEAWRIISGLPAMGAELTEERNPLEAGLRDAVSFTKGCYVGQEVIARLNTYDKVSRELLRLELPPGVPMPARGAAVRWDGRDVGAITSAAKVPGRDFVVATHRPAPHASTLHDYLWTAHDLVQTSGQQLTQVRAAISAGDADALRRLQEGRSKLLATVEGWDVPPAAREATLALEEALRSTVISDSNWASVADRTMSSSDATSYDMETVHPAKLKFDRLYNQLLNGVEDAPPQLPTDTVTW